MELNWRILLRLVFIFFSIFGALLNSNAVLSQDVYANQWAVYMEGGLELANEVAREHGFRNVGPVGMLKDVYFFTHRAVPKRHRRSTLLRNVILERDSRVSLVVQQKVKKRVKRDASTLHFTDRRWKDQWFLHRTEPAMKGHDMNILPAWEKGITGKGVVVTILDDGIEYTHIELKKNYDQNASYDYNDNDPDPMPKWQLQNKQHGTRCAAQVAAEANNSFCIVGVAYNSRIGGIRMLDGDVTDLVESRSLMHQRDYVDIYSASWGPEDDGLTVDGPANLTRLALREGVLYGRGGKGSIFVWASGNGGHVNDDCNCDGYTNSIYTISAAAATSYGTKPWYLEECASTLVTAYGSGESTTDRKIVTADLNGGCTYRHTGTSVAAPYVAGFIALALEVNPKLTWRDVQHVLVRTANMKHLDKSNIRLNGVKRKFSTAFGFGVLDGGAMVDLAAKWILASEQHVCKTPLSKKSTLINTSQPLIIDIDTTGCKGTKNFIRYLEHVHLVVSLMHSSRGEVSIYIVSAMGTRSQVLKRRKKDYKKGTFKQWEFLSNHMWGENPIGRWKIEIHSRSGSGYLQDWQFVFYGSEFAPGEPYPDVTATEYVPGQKGTKCHKECLDGCTGPEAFECNTCRNYKVVDGNRTCVERCPGNYLTDEITLLCLPCKESCWSCFGPYSNECSSCKDDKVLFQNECVEKCPPDYFKSSHVHGFKCQRCDGNCLRCTGSAENCTQCKPEDLLLGNHCFARCDHESYFDGVNCINCHRSCHTCNGPTSENCTSCRYKGLHGRVELKTTYLYKGSCLPKCPVSYYGDQLKGLCEPCGKDCLRCEAEGEKCLVCRHGYFRLPNNPKECVKRCLKGQYPDLLLGVCRPCSHNCQLCLPGHPHECTSCGSLASSQPVFLKQSSCVYEVNCGLRFFANKTSGRCDICPFPCTTCNENENCQSCFNHYVNVDDERCMEKCPSGTYRDLNRKCVNCHPSCKECMGPGVRHCRKCHRGMVLLKDKSCSWYCPVEGYYRDVEAQLCKPCNPSCLQCYGPNINQCIRCIKNLDLRGTTCVQPCVDNYLTENSCEPCHKHCKTCYGPKHTDCLSCYHNMTLHNYECKRYCPKGHYQDSKHLCQLCHRECATCRGPESNNCLSCTMGSNLLDGKCLHKCPRGYFQEEDECRKCSSNCAECRYSEYICMHCKEGKVWKDFACQDSCGEGLFVMPETRRCHRCHQTCKTCFGFNADQCSSCQKGAWLYNSMCFEECPARYIAQAPTQLCNACPDNCFKCSKASNYTMCELCRHPYINFNGKCVKACPGVNYYHNYYTKTCEKCHESCKVCYGPSQSDCIVCKKNFVLLGHKCIISNCSKDTYLDPKTFQCDKCNPKCRSCTGPGINKCTECQAGYVLHQSSCILGCKDGSFPDESMGKCYHCDASCKSCNGPSANDCTACKKDHTLIDGACILGCKEGEYPDDASRQCKRCHVSCNSCNGPHAMNCTACKRQHALLGNACVLSCNDGMFPDIRLSKCRQCSHVCKTCVGSTAYNCTTCERDFTLVGGTCVLDCAEGRYPDTARKHCEHCHALCKSCNGPTAVNCTSCKKEFTLIGSRCVLDCSEGKFAEESTYQCKHCHVKCKTCQGPSQNNCTSCHKEYTLIDGKCVLDCPGGKFADSGLGKCKHCNAMCKSCNGSTSRNCTSCKKGYTLIDGSCILFCNEGSYSDEKNLVCLPCHSRCRSCSGPSDGECRGCKEGYVLKDNKCIPDCTSGAFYDKKTDSCVKCMHPCSSCYGPKVTDCTSCKSNYNLVENTCFPTCKASEYLDNAKWRCVECDNSCESCFGPYRSNCTRCKLGYMLFDNICFMVCTDGTFPNYETERCHACSRACSVCTGPLPGDCETCSKGYRMVGGKCSLDCQPGTFANDALEKCQKCHNNCLTCSGPTPRDCVSCFRNSSLIGSECRLRCDDGYYPTTNSAGFQVCDKCPDMCLTCDGPRADQCLLCNQGYVQSGSSCVKICPKGEFFSVSKKDCEQCSEGCLECDSQSGTLNCTTCLQGYTLKDNTCERQCHGNATYYDAATNSCMPCAKGCLSCSASTAKSCGQCKEGYAKIGNSCQLYCDKLNTFADMVTEQCLPCDASCSQCNGPNDSDCIVCSDGYELHNATTCRLKCGNGTYLEEHVSECKECHLSCSECSGSGNANCTACKGEAVLATGRCNLQCNELGEYAEPDEFVCRSCHDTCTSCNGPTARNCTACERGFVLVKNQCVQLCQDGFYMDKQNLECYKCYDENCLMCTGPLVEDCQTCANGFKMETTRCVRNCSNGHFTVANSECLKCNDTCLECEGQRNNCTACADGLLKEGATCVRMCSSGRFIDPVANKCLKCNETCATCDGPGQHSCSLCADGKFFNRLTSECLERCEPAQFAVDRECFNCHSSCSSCDGPLVSNCLLCAGNLTLYNSTCINAACPIGFYKEIIGNHSLCRSCSVKCRTCSGQGDDQCKSCDEGLYLQGMQCVEVCLEPYVENNDTRTCEPTVNKKPLVRRLQEIQDEANQHHTETSSKVKYNSPITIIIVLLLLIALGFFVNKKRQVVSLRVRKFSSDLHDYANPEACPWTERESLKKPSSTT